MCEDSRIHSVLQRPNEISKRSPLNRTDIEVKVKSKKSLPAPGKQTPRAGLGLVLPGSWACAWSWSSRLTLGIFLASSSPLKEPNSFVNSNGTPHFKLTFFFYRREFQTTTP